MTRITFGAVATAAWQLFTAIRRQVSLLSREINGTPTPFVLDWIVRGIGMHKFQVGQTVFLSPSPTRNILGGVYTVTRKLPEREGQFEYRVKSANELHERVTTEDQLSAASGSRH